MHQMDTLINQFPYLGIFILLVLGDFGLPFPEDATLLLSGFLIAQNVIKLLPTLLVVYSGLLMTDFFLYWVGKKYGKRVVEHKRFHKIISPERLLKIEEKFKKWGIFIIFFGRHLVGIRAQIFLAAGVVEMHMAKFLLADAISAFITIGLWVGIGFLGGNSLQVLKKDMTRIEHIAIVVFVILLAGWFIFRYFEGYKKSKDE